jgi:hypothetical protein
VVSAISLLSSRAPTTENYLGGVDREELQHSLESRTDMDLLGGLSLL